MFFKCQKRFYLLLEVVIAFAIAAFCILPLLAPHFAIYREQRHFVSKIELDMAVMNFYSLISEKLQRNEIPWEAIEQMQSFPIQTDFWSNVWKRPLPFVGEYRLKIDKVKKNDDYGLYLVKLTLKLRSSTPQNQSKPLKFEFDYFVTKIFKTPVLESVPKKTSDQNEMPANPKPPPKK